MRIRVSELKPKIASLLAREGPLNKYLIAKKLGCEYPTLLEAVKEMEGEGLIKIVARGRRRAQVYDLTPKGAVRCYRLGWLELDDLIAYFSSRDAALKLYDMLGGDGFEGGWEALEGVVGLCFATLSVPELEGFEGCEDPDRLAEAILRGAVEGLRKAEVSPSLREALKGKGIDIDPLKGLLPLPKR